MEGEQELGGEMPAQNPTPNYTSSSDGGGRGKKGSPCEECGEQPWKYRCPGCVRLPCSLPCVQSHKPRISCTGKRARTDPVPLSDFDDNYLLSDYNLLEETKQVSESAHRLIVSFGRNYGGGRGAQLPAWLFHLLRAVLRRGIRHFFLPRGMTRGEQNRSRHNHRDMEWEELSAATGFLFLNNMETASSTYVSPSFPPICSDATSLVLPYPGPSYPYHPQNL